MAEQPTHARAPEQSAAPRQPTVVDISSAVTRRERERERERERRRKRERKRTKKKKWAGAVAFVAHTHTASDGLRWIFEKSWHVIGQAGRRGRGIFAVRQTAAATEENAEGKFFNTMNSE